LGKLPCQTFASTRSTKYIGPGFQDVDDCSKNTLSLLAVIKEREGSIHFFHDVINPLSFDIAILERQLDALADSGNVSKLH
jgi:hypothetical protein